MTPKSPPCYLILPPTNLGPLLLSRPHWQSLLIAVVQLLLSSWPVPSPTLQPLQTKLVEGYAHSPPPVRNHQWCEQMHDLTAPCHLVQQQGPHVQKLLPPGLQPDVLLACNLSLWFTLCNGSICSVSRSHSLSLSRCNKCLSLSPCYLTCSIAHSFSTTASNLTIWLKIHDNLPRRRQFPFECLRPCPGCSQLLPQQPNLHAIFAGHA